MKVTLTIPFIDSVARWMGYEPRNQGKRDFAGAMTSRLHNDWGASSSTADGEIKGAVKPMRDRCRDLERNNDFVRRYFKLLENNVLGANGIGLQMKVLESKTVNGKWTTKLDTIANDLIELSWYKWGHAKYCDKAGHLDLSDMCKIALRSVARDGSVMFRKHYPKDNPFRFSLEPIESDCLDTDYNVMTPSGGLNAVRLGVEYDATGTVVAYHLLRNHPGDLYTMRPNGMWRERVPAEQIIHLYMPERFGQSTGFPWLASCLSNLRHLEKYIEAEVVASRVSAAKMGFLVANPNAPGSGYAGATDASGNKYMEVEPGSIEQLPQGYNFQTFDPTHPNSIFPDFVKAQLRAISSGLGVSYTSLANDLEGVNYSSIRAGLLEEREEWKAIQNWFIGWFLQPVFEDWLMNALLTGQISNGTVTLPSAKFDKFNAPEWKPRRWDWVDPLKDMNAAVLAVEKRFKSRSQIIGEAGGDFQDTLRDIKAEEDLAEDMGIELNDTEANPEPPEPIGTVDKEDKADA